MAGYFFLKGREGGYFDEQKEMMLDFLDAKGYKNICFLLDSIKKMSADLMLGKALVRRWGDKAVAQFVKSRAIQINGVDFSFGTVNTLGNDLYDFDAIVHVYAYTNGILDPLDYTHESDHIFLYWVREQPELDQWLAILNAQPIRAEERIEPVTFNIPQEVKEQLDFIREVNVGDGASHKSDEQLIRDVVKTINLGNHTIDEPTFKAYIIREVGFKPNDAERVSRKIEKYFR